MRTRLLWLAAGALSSLLFLAVPAARAQVAWDSPYFLPPGAPAGWGVYLVDPAHGSGLGVLGTWRATSAPGGLGFRLGLAEDRRDELAVYGGVDLSGSLVRASNDTPVDVAWVTGVGVSVGDAGLVSFPLGISVGRKFRTEDVTFNPYITPRVVLDAWFGSDRPRRSTDLELAVDLGVDLVFQPGWGVRFGATLGDRSAVGIGLSFRG